MGTVWGEGRYCPRPVATARGGGGRLRNIMKKQIKEKEVNGQWGRAHPVGSKKFLTRGKRGALNAKKINYALREKDEKK